MPGATLPLTLPFGFLADPVLDALVEVRPDTEQMVIVTDADGNTKTLHSNAADPGDRPRNITFSSQLGSGYYTGAFNLARPIDRDHDDIHLLDDVKIVLATGDVVYQGFVAAMPRSLDDTHTLGVTLAGWMASAADRTFTMPFIDRDLSAWGEVSIAQRIAAITATYNPEGANFTVAPDPTGTPGIVSSRPGVLNKPWQVTVYDAGQGANVARLYVGTQSLIGLGSGDANLEVYALSWSTADGATPLLTSNVKASTSIDFTPTTAQRFAALLWKYNGTAGGTNGVDYGTRWQNVHVIGDHGLPTYDDDDTGEPQGVAASDVIRWLVENFCPFLNTAGVQDTTYPIAQLAFKDTPARPYDAFLKVNSYHQWNLAVWEAQNGGIGGTLHFEPIDLTDWDFEIRHDEAGNKVGLQGDEYTNLRSRLPVQFTNLATGAVELLSPDDHPELRDESVDHPANTHGRPMDGDPFTIPFPTTQGNALELGRLRLLEDNAPKAPGSFTVEGHIRDRSGQWRPCSEVRSGDRIRLTSSASLSDRPRLIHECSYSHDGTSVTIAVDSTLRVLDAFLDRTATALAAAGFG